MNPKVVTPMSKKLQESYYFKAQLNKQKVKLTNDYKLLGNKSVWIF